MRQDGLDFLAPVPEEPERFGNLEVQRIARSGLGGLGRLLNVGAYASDITFEDSARENIGREIAIAALGFAKGNGNVQSQRHLYDYPTAVVCRLQLCSTGGV